LPPAGRASNCVRFLHQLIWIGAGPKHHGIASRDLKRGMTEVRGMPLSAVRNFTHPNSYHAAIRNAEVEGIVTARAELTWIVLRRLWMQREQRSFQP
jgi:hypothetical protein